MYLFLLEGWGGGGGGGGVELVTLIRGKEEIRLSMRKMRKSSTY